MNVHENTETDRRLARIAIRLVYASCIGLVLVDFMVQKHPHFGIENLPGFYALFGFGAFMVIVWGGVQLRKFVRREENYYDKKSGDV